MTGKLAPGTVRWAGAVVPGPECSPKGNQPLTPLRSQGTAGARKGLTLGRLPGQIRVQDRGPVPPLPSLRLSWKPKLAGWREQWVPLSPWAPVLPTPTVTLPSLAGLLLSGGRAATRGREELSSALLCSVFSPRKDGWWRGGGSGMPGCPDCGPGSEGMYTDVKRSSEDIRPG